MSSSSSSVIMDGTRWISSMKRAFILCEMTVLTEMWSIQLEDRNAVYVAHLNVKGHILSITSSAAVEGVQYPGIFYKTYTRYEIMYYILLARCARSLYDTVRSLEALYDQAADLRIFITLLNNELQHILEIINSDGVLSCSDKKHFRNSIEAHLMSFMNSHECISPPNPFSSEGEFRMTHNMRRLTRKTESTYINDFNLLEDTHLAVNVETEPHKSSSAPQIQDVTTVYRSSGELCYLKFMLGSAQSVTIGFTSRPQSNRTTVLAACFVPRRINIKAVKIPHTNLVETAATMPLPDSPALSGNVDALSPEEINSLGTQYNCSWLLDEMSSGQKDFSRWPE